MLFQSSCESDLISQSPVNAAALQQNDSNSHSPAKKKKKEKRTKRDKESKQRHQNNRSVTPLSPAAQSDSATSRNEELTLSDGELESKRAALLAQLNEQLDE